MDLLCTESIVTHSEQALHRYKKKTPTVQQNTNNFNINCNCITCSSVCFSTMAKCNTAAADATTDSIPAVSVRVPSACNMSKLVYVISSVATPTSPTLSTKQLKQTQLNNDQLLNQLPSHHNCHNSKLTAETNETEAVGDKRFVYENAHVIVTDPIFKSDRCLENALKSEVKAQIRGTYLKTVQKDITPPMRKIVAEWMMEVCAEEKCQEEVVLLAINYMDRFLSSKSIRKTHLQILAAACLLVASKIREPTCRALSAELLVFYTDNSINKDDLIILKCLHYLTHYQKWELYMLSRLGWDISSVTPLDFLELWIIRLSIKCKDFSDWNTEKVRHLAQTFICLAAKEYKFSKYTASTIAASSIVAAMNQLKCHLCTGDNIHIFFTFFTDLTSVGQEQLHQCMIQMEVLYNDQSHKIQPYFLGIDKQQSCNAYYNSPYLQSDQHHQKRLMSVLPKIAQTCKLQAHAQNDLHEIQF